MKRSITDGHYQTKTVQKDAAGSVGANKEPKEAKKATQSCQEEQVDPLLHSLFHTNLCDVTWSRQVTLEG